MRLWKILYFYTPFRDYSNTEPFNVLIKVGPLRSKGWGAVPDAVISAPRYGRLVQLVWSGCKDEPGFGYDPVESSDALSYRIPWKKHVERSGFDSGLIDHYIPEQDEFIIFPVPIHIGTQRQATLIEILKGDGILYPYRAKVLSFDLNSETDLCLDSRIPGESLFEGMFVVQAHIGEVDFGESNAAEGGYNGVWKQRLREELTNNSDAFCRKLRSKGLNLLTLSQCVNNWAELPHAVIHAPQKRGHFKILIDTLEIESAAAATNGWDKKPWWQQAWDEVRISRGEAIQAGIQGQELIDQQSLKLLRESLSEIKSKALSDEYFRIDILPDRDLQGYFVFYKILRLEEGFLAPDSDIYVVRDLNSLEEWKTT